MERTDKKNCEYHRQIFSHGSELDQGERKLICIDGKWVDLDELESVGC